MGISQLLLCCAQFSRMQEGDPPLRSFLREAPLLLSLLLLLVLQLLQVPLLLVGGHLWRCVVLLVLRLLQPCWSTAAPLLLLQCVAVVADVLPAAVTGAGWAVPRLMAAVRELPHPPTPQQALHLLCGLEQMRIRDPPTIAYLLRVLTGQPGRYSSSLQQHQQQQPLQQHPHQQLHQQLQQQHPEQRLQQPAAAAASFIPSKGTPWEQQTLEPSPMRPPQCLQQVFRASNPKP